MEEQKKQGGKVEVIELRPDRRYVFAWQLPHDIPENVRINDARAATKELEQWWNGDEEFFHLVVPSGIEVEFRRVPDESQAEEWKPKYDIDTLNGIRSAFGLPELNPTQESE